MIISASAVAFPVSTRVPRPPPRIETYPHPDLELRKLATFPGCPGTNSITIGSNRERPCTTDSIVIVFPSSYQYKYVKRKSYYY
eukprot:158134-Rhodomonas_salina.2